MIAIDKNQTLEPPEGDLIATYASGGFLSLVYYSDVVRTEVFLNDQGREVMRTVKGYKLPEPEPEPQPQYVAHDWSNSAPRARWYRFCAGFWLALYGLREMSKCLKL